MSENHVQTNIRLPEGLKERIVASAKDNQRSMGAEMVARLESSFQVEERVGDLLPKLESLRDKLVETSGHEQAMAALAEENARLTEDNRALRSDLTACRDHAKDLAVAFKTSKILLAEFERRLGAGEPTDLDQDSVTIPALDTAERKRSK